MHGWYLSFQLQVCGLFPIKFPISKHSIISPGCHAQFELAGLLCVRRYELQNEGQSETSWPVVLITNSPYQCSHHLSCEISVIQIDLLQGHNHTTSISHPWQPPITYMELNCFESGDLSN